MQNLFEVIRQRPPWSKPLTGRFFLNLLLVFIGLTGFAFFLTVLFISMRGVLRLGGMVASGGFSIGWLICGVMFWIMGGLPLLPMLANLLSIVRNELRSPHYVAAAPPAAELEVFPGRVKGTALFILHTTAIVVGIGEAIRFFQAIE